MDKKITLAVAVLLAMCGACRPNQQEESPTSDQHEPQLAPEEPTSMQAEPAKPGDGMEGQRATGTTAAATLKVEDVAGKPDMYMGERITVQGEVDDVLNAHALTLEGEGKHLVVLGRKDAAWIVSDDLSDKRVLITGTLQRMSTPTEVEKNLGWDFDTKIEDEMKDAKVLLIATNLQPIENDKPGTGEQMKSPPRGTPQPVPTH